MLSKKVISFQPDSIVQTGKQQPKPKIATRNALRLMMNDDDDAKSWMCSPPTSTNERKRKKNAESADATLSSTCVETKENRKSGDNQEVEH